MYRNENEFVRGQKIKLILIGAIMAIVLIYSHVTTGSLTDGWW